MIHMMIYPLIALAVLVSAIVPTDLAYIHVNAPEQVVVYKCEDTHKLPYKSREMIDEVRTLTGYKGGCYEI